ncbi:conserved hypothetical protein [Halobacteriovorax marinus SJ]|uniref:Uncharacterized protein n=1 Tax=Halobacteriovorax marinus (strain ATCC BAA-682 / DSM 15412 / SJ) TaxID=862908 RepID=E1WY37_HALMS|nr:DUF6172 family protein [Halobacteriovorax marinus]CBW27592.1 conserved hypothetical protein [Halobacteriovorax marinus SJ]
MKKIFNLTAPNKKPERQADSVKYEIKKYIKRERRKELPEGHSCWELDCKIGKDQNQAQVITPDRFSSMIDEFVAQGCESIYVEVLSRAGHRPKKK